MDRSPQRDRLLHPPDGGSVSPTTDGRRCVFICEATCGSPPIPSQASHVPIKYQRALSQRDDSSSHLAVLSRVQSSVWPREIMVRPSADESLCSAAQHGDDSRAGRGRDRFRLRTSPGK